MAIDYIHSVSAVCSGTPDYTAGRYTISFETDYVVGGEPIKFDPVSWVVEVLDKPDNCDRYYHAANWIYCRVLSGSGKSGKKTWVDVEHATLSRL